jgi:response regulator RpfG family c-di-GMP phosphodiesterase
MVEAADPRTALQIVEADPDCLDLLVTDVVMPGRTGVDLARRLHEVRPATGVFSCRARPPMVSTQMSGMDGIESGRVPNLGRRLDTRRWNWLGLEPLSRP